MINSSRIFGIICSCLVAATFVHGQTASPDSTRQKKEETIKEGLGFGGLPVVGYNTDIGFQYGIIFNLFNYGDGSYYPGYKWSLYTEFSRTTKGSGVNQVFFDSKHLLPGKIRITADLSYLTELALDFYGFNGYDAVYNREFKTESDDEYISRMYYNHQRKMTRFVMDLQGPLLSDRLLWFAGIGYMDMKVSTIDLDRLNKGKDEQDLLPDTALLYDDYIRWGIIRENEKDGGHVPNLKIGLIYDSRDQEANPMKGIWTEALLFYSPPVFGNHDYAYLKLSITHRQYFTLIKDDLSFAYRLGYQGMLAGKVPFYMEPYMITSFSMATITDGLGGAKTLRGILRNRVVGDGVGYGNFELRWKFFRFLLWNQNFYLALNAFADAGRVLKEREVEPVTLNPPADMNDYFSPGAEKWHLSAGGGFRIVMNRNFVVACDYGKAFDTQDGKDGLYIGIGYLF